MPLERTETGTDPLQAMRWMSQTSSLASVPSEPPSLACPTPQGRAMAAEKGRPVPLVSRSELGADIDSS